ncbi:F-box protein At2g26160-like [Solanum verrucosum]|nr:F-box protein At2g26160-like [Solanum verrucosum]
MEYQLSSKMSADWSKLPYDLLVLIARRFNLIENYLNFGIVCKSWHSVTTKDNFNNDLPRIPWLMLAEEGTCSCRKFFSLYNGMILKKKIPKASGKRCMESMGWLITVGKDAGEISLLHPFSGVEIELPHPNTMENYEHDRTAELWTFFSKAVLSASPSHTSDYVLMVMVPEGLSNNLSFWRPGDLRWNRIIWDEPEHVDVTYFNGHFYSVGYWGRVLVHDVASSQPTRNVIAQLEDAIGHENHLYILESLGSLFVVARYGVVELREDHKLRLSLDDIRFEDNYIYGTISFRVFQVDLAGGKVTETRELGDRAFFVGHSASLSVQASQFPGIKSNHIYFTDDFWKIYLNYEEGGGSDMGVFSLADGSIQPHYEDRSMSRVCPPIWVTPTLY